MQKTTAQKTNKKFEVSLLHTFDHIGRVSIEASSLEEAIIKAKKLTYTDMHEKTDWIKDGTKYSLVVTGVCTEETGLTSSWDKAKGRR